MGIDPENLPVAADKLRRLLHFGQVLQSHALYFFHLSSPDLLFGFESDISKRNIIAVLTDYPEVGLQGVKLRKFGQEVIRMFSGKRMTPAYPVRPMRLVKYAYKLNLLMPRVTVLIN